MIRTPRARLCLAAVPVLAALLCLAPSVASAQSGDAFSGVEHIRNYDVAMQIVKDGTLRVRERIDYDFGPTPHHGIYRDIPVRFSYDGTHDRVYRIVGLAVSGSPGTPTGFETLEEGRLERIKIGDPNVEISGRHTYEISYAVLGALNGFADHDELYWNAIGTEWTVPISRATVVVGAPAQILRAACFAGPEGSRTGCRYSDVAVHGTVARFAQEGLGAYEGLTTVIAIPTGAVPPPKPILEERFSPVRAFAVTPATAAGGGTLLLLALGGVFALAYRHGRDRRFIGSPVDVVHGAPAGSEEEGVPLHDRMPLLAELEPPGGIRPGQVGTLIDERAQPLDVTASIVDLAQRGYLTITETSTDGLLHRADWRLTKQRDGDGLLDYERTLFDGLFSGGDQVDLSDLKNRFYATLHEVESELYDDAVRQGWFAARPDRVRAVWSLIGIAALVAGCLILALVAASTHLALVALPLPIAGFALLVCARYMPRRTPAGTGLLRRVQGFRYMMETADTQLARFAEKERLYYAFLPYAVVFGITDRWARAFAALGVQPAQPGWYVSRGPFVFASFSRSLDGFASRTTTVAASTPSSSGSSGFGGGGFSGGGGGGGGGGSW